MRKYSTPVAEKVEFNYQDVIVTSGNQCHTGGEYSDEGIGCTENQTVWAADVAS